MSEVWIDLVDAMPVWPDTAHLSAAEVREAKEERLNLLLAKYEGEPLTPELIFQVIREEKHLIHQAIAAGLVSEYPSRVRDDIKIEV